MKTTLINPTLEGQRVTLTWRGEAAPHLISDLHGWEDHPQPLTQVEPGLWAISFELAADAYFEYAFYDPHSKVRFRDPLNRKTVYNGIGNYNHYFYMPEARATSLARQARGGLRGKLTRHTVDAKFMTVDAERRVYLYRPPVSEALPLLCVYDGLDYLRRGKLTEIVDNLIAARRIRPLALAFVNNGGYTARMVEYGCSEPTVGFLIWRVLPLAAKEMNLLDFRQNPGVHGIMGASMGGLMSVFTALKAPDVFGKALSQAGAFEMDEQETIAMQMVRYFPRPDVKIWLDCGAMDFLRTSNRKLAQLLAEKGYDHRYRESGGAHNYTTWRNACVEGLEYLFG